MKNETILDEDTMIQDPGIYIVQHHKNSKSSSRVCKLSDLKNLSLPRRAALETKKDEICTALLASFKGTGMSISDEVNMIFDILSKVDEETSDKENGLFIMGSDW